MHHPSGIMHALLSEPTSARTGHVCAPSFRGLQAFFGPANPLKGASMHKDLLIHSPLGIASIQIGRDSCSAERLRSFCTLGLQWNTGMI